MTNMLKKVFNWSEVHLSEVTSYKIHTLAPSDFRLEKQLVLPYDLKKSYPKKNSTHIPFATQCREMNYENSILSLRALLLSIRKLSTKSSTKDRTNMKKIGPCSMFVSREQSCAPLHMSFLMK